ncbi:MAG TPA: PAS domain-containing protein [Gemmatirosa sp.]
MPHFPSDPPPVPPASDPSALAPVNTQRASALLESADAMTPDELDALPYGMIQLDASGRILKYNAVESRLASLPQAQAVGKQFFTEIAPCTKVQQFYGRFKDGVVRESLDTSFQFHFAFKQAPRDVTVRLFYSRRTRSVWVMISDHQSIRVTPALGQPALAGR